MNRDNDRQTSIILAVLGILPIVWLGLLIAPSVKGGLPEILPSLMNVMSDPFHIELCEDSVKTVLVLLLCYGMGIGIYFSTRRNYRRREEHGSAKWGKAKAVDKKYRQNPPSENKLMTQAVRIGLNGKKHRRNLNTLVCGGSGAGKTRFYCKPNLMQANTSFVILDPKGEIVRDVGNLLEKKGYEIRVLDLISMEKSHCYNPFVYLHSDNDVQRLVTNLFKSTTPKGSQSNDPFWDTSASMLLSALVYYLHYEAPKDEQNFAMVMEMLQAAAIDNEEDPRPSPLDCLFADLELDRPDHIALKYYRSYHTGSAKTLKSIQITLVSRLEKFNLTSLAGITQTDEMDLWRIGEQKTALRIRHLFLPVWMKGSEKENPFILAAQKAGIMVEYLKKGDEIRAGELTVSVLHPGAGEDYTGEENAGSVVLQLSCGACRALLTGDLEGSGEEEVLGAAERCQILKVAHHGSKNSTSEAFLNRIQPQISLISCAWPGRYGHPHRELLERLRACKSHIYGTPVDGAVTVQLKRDRLAVHGYWSDVEFPVS